MDTGHFTKNSCFKKHANQRDSILAKRIAKRCYSEKLKLQFSVTDSTALWRGLQDITSYKRPSLTVEAKIGLADDLNAFYLRLKWETLTPLPHFRLERETFTCTTHSSPTAAPPLTWLHLPLSPLSLNLHSSYCTHHM